MVCRRRDCFQRDCETDSGTELIQTLVSKIANQYWQFWLLLCIQNCSSLCFSGYQRPWNRCDFFPSTTMHTVPSYEITYHSTSEFLQWSNQCSIHRSNSCDRRVFWMVSTSSRKYYVFIFEGKKSVVFLMYSLGCFTLSQLSSLHIQRSYSMETKQSP